MIMDRLYGGVCYAGIDTDPELKYPKGAGRVAFSNQQSYIAAISARFVQLQHGEIDKRVSPRLHAGKFQKQPSTCVTTKIDRGILCDHKLAADRYDCRASRCMYTCRNFLGIALYPCLSRLPRTLYQFTCQFNFS